jgi:diguanylate cyclase (GGDEF)-like protein
LPAKKRISTQALASLSQKRTWPLPSLAVHLPQCHIPQAEQFFKLGRLTFCPRWSRILSKGMGRKLLLAAIFACLLPSFLFCQTHPFQIYGLDEGLPQSQITCLAQDQEGYIWVGTDGGLVRFNGERFTSFISRDALPSSRISRLMLDSRGTLWIATLQGLAKWQEHRLTSIKDPAVSRGSCRGLAEDSRGNLWVGTNHGLVLRKNGTFVSVTGAGGREMGMIYDLIPDGDGVMGISARGMFRATAGSPAVKVAGPPAPENSFRALARTAEGLWLSTTQQGLYLYDGRRWSAVPPSQVKARTVYWMSQAPSGNFCVASRDEGLLRRLKGQKTFEVFNKDNGLASNVVNCALEDNQGNLWVGTEIKGLARLRNSSIVNYDKSDGLPDNCVLGITPASRPHEVWFGTTNGAVRCRLNGHLEVLERLSTRDGLADNIVWKVISTPRGDEWVMSDTAYHRRRPGETRFTVLSRQVPIPAREIFSLALDNQGRVWFAGMDNEASIAVLDTTGHWRSWNRSEEGSPIPRCRGVSPRRAGGIWAAAETRILYSDGLSLHEMPDRLPVSAGETDAVLEDHQGRIWAGFDGGVAIHEEGKGWRLIRNAGGSPINQVYFVGEDREGTIWVGFSNGVLRILPSGGLEVISSDKGLAGIETNQGGFYESPDGSIWVGTVSGLSRIDLERLPSLVTAPPIVIEAAELPSRTVPFPQNLDLPWKERTMTFRVAVLAYGGQQTGRYRARLQGMETDWVLSRKGGGGLRYTNIPAGRYSLQLQAALEIGGWGPLVTVPVRIRAPYWMTWWFRLAIVLLVAGLVVWIFLRRTRLLREHAEQLQRVVAERTEELVSANRELQRLATHDPLTGLWNRRAILDKLASACRLEEGTGPSRPCGLIMVDIDDFKKVNDELGHVAGDQVLRDIAQQIEGQTREKDAVGRYGGDEFLVVLDGIGRTAVESAARRIAEKPYTSRVGNKTVTVTVSCGALSVAAKTPLTETTVLTRADDLLYKRKKTGKHGYLINALGPSVGRRR